MNQFDDLGTRPGRGRSEVMFRMSCRIFKYRVIQTLVGGPFEILLV